MAACLPNTWGTFTPANRGEIVSSVRGLSLGAFRLPTDPLFYADLVLDNIIVGSRYRVTRHSTGDELATGVAASTSETLASLPCYSNPMQVDITVRNASGSPAYRVFDTGASLSKTGGSAYILQQLDE